MLPHRRDPYLWIHLAGLATVPLWLDGCLVGLAVGEPQIPPWLELIPLAAIGTAPILWMQWQRPFYIFSVPGLALRPDKLSVERRRLLTIQRGWLSRSLVIITAITLLWALYTLYQVAPLAADLPWLAGKSRATGWTLSAIAFFLANLFALVPATVVPLFLTNPGRLENVPPVDASKILSKFTVIGLRLGKILPEPELAEFAPLDEPAEPPAPTAVASSEDDLEPMSPGESDDPGAVSDESGTAKDQPMSDSETTAAIAREATEEIQPEQVPPQDANATPENSVMESESSETIAAMETTEMANPSPSSAAASETSVDPATTVEIAADGSDASAETLTATDAAASNNGTGHLNPPQADET